MTYQSPRTLLCAALTLALAPCLAASSCATTGQGQSEYAADYCAELLPDIEEQIAQSQQDPAHSDRVDVSVSGPFGESLSMSMEVSEGGGTAQPVQTGLSDLVFNCGTDMMDERTCAANIYLDGELIGRGNYQSTGQLAMRCLPAGDRELRIVAPDGNVFFHDVITLRSDVEYMAHLKEEGIDATFEIYGESDIPFDFSAQPQSDGSGVSIDAQVDEGHLHHEASVETSYSESHDSHSRRAHDEPSVRDATDQSPMSRTNFRDLLHRVEDATFDSDKRGIIEDAMGSNYFQSSQAASLITALDSMNDQEDIAIKIYDRIVDPGQFYQVIDEVDSSISRDNIRDELNL